MDDDKIGLPVYPDFGNYAAEFQKAQKKFEDSFKANVSVVFDHSQVAKEYQKLQKEMEKLQKNLPGQTPLPAAPKNSPPKPEKAPAPSGLDTAWLRRMREQYKKELSGLEATISASADPDELREELEGEIRELESTLKLKIPTDPKGVEEFRRSIESQMRDLHNRKVSIEVDIEQNRHFEELQNLVDDLDDEQVTVDADVDANTASAAAHITAFTKRPRNIKLDAKIDSGSLIKVGTALAALSGVRSVNNMLTSMGRSLSNLDQSAPKIAGIGTAIGGIGGAALASVSNLASLAASLTSIIGLAGLMPAAFGAAGAGLGTLFAAFSGVGEALGAASEAKAPSGPTENPMIAAIQTQQAQQAVTRAYEDADRARVESARSIIRAEVSVADAVEAAADGQVAAKERVADAARAEKRSIENVEDAQKALNEAYKDAKERLEDLDSQLKNAKLSQADAVAAKQDAIDAYNQAYSDPATTPDALAALERQKNKAIQSLADQKREVKNLAAEKKDADKNGAKGSDEVLSAEERLTDAKRSASDATRDRKKAQAAVTEQELDGIRSIQDAEQSLEDARDAAAQSQIDSARSVKSAQQSLLLMELQRAETQNAAANAANEAMAKLTPSAQTAVVALLAVKDRLSEVRDIAQENFFKGFAAPLTNLADVLIPQLKVGVGELATAMGSGAQELMDALSASLGGGVLQEMLSNTAVATTEANAAIAPLTQAMSDIGLVGSTFLPQLATGFADASARFGEFIGKAKDDGSLAAFIQGGIDAAKELGSILGSAFSILGGISGAAAEAGGSTLSTFADMLERVAAIVNEEPFQSASVTIFEGANDMVSNLGESLGPIGQMFVDMAPTLKEVMGTIGTTLATALTAVAETLGDPAMQEGIKALFDGLLIGIEALAPVMPVVGEALGAVLKLAGKLLEAIGPILGALLEGIGPLITTLAEMLMPLIDALTPLLVTVAEVIGTVLGAAFERIKPILNFVVGVLEGWIPILESLAEFIGAVFTGDVEGAFAAIGDIVSGFGDLIKKYFTELIPNLVGGLVGNFTEMGAKVLDSLLGTGNGISEGLRDIGDGIGDFFKGAGSWLVDSGRALIQGFIDGIKGMVGKVGDAASGLMDWVGGFFPNSPAKRGPFSGTGWTPYRGKSMGMGLAEGLEASKIDVAKASLGLMKSVEIPKKIPVNVTAKAVGNRFTPEQQQDMLQKRLATKKAVQQIHLHEVVNARNALIAMNRLDRKKAK